MIFIFKFLTWIHYDNSNTCSSKKFKLNLITISFIFVSCLVIFEIGIRLALIRKVYIQTYNVFKLFESEGKKKFD